METWTIKHAKIMLQVFGNFSLLLCIFCFSVAESASIKELANTLLSKYNSKVRPLCQGFETVQVTIDMAVRQLISLNEPEQVVQFNVWMRLTWNDCNLVWNPVHYNGTDYLTMPVTSIWKPDITLYDSTTSDFYGFDKYMATIYSNGHVIYNFPSQIEVLCPVDVSKFPYDKQICQLMFGSWTYHGDQVNVSSKRSKADLSSIKENVEWIIEDAPIETHVVYYGCCPEPFPDVTVYIHLKRKPSYYITNIIIPAILVTMVAAFGYLLPVESGEKVGLELTVMLAMSVFQLLVADKLPPSADATPWISVFFNFTMGLSGGSSLWQVLVLNIYYKGNRPMPQWIKRCILRPLSAMFCVSSAHLPSSAYEINQESSTDKLNDASLSNGKVNPKLDLEIRTATDTKDDSEYWIQLSLVLDRMGLLFFILSLGCGFYLIFMGILKAN